MKNKLMLWVIVGLVLIISALIIFWPNKEPNSEKVTALEQGIAHADLKIIQLTKDSTKLAEKIKGDSIRQADEKTSYVATIKKQGDIIASLRANPKVIKVLEENPEVENLVEQFINQDVLKSARIDTLESNLRELRVDLAGVTANFEDILKTEREKFLMQESLTKEYKQQVRKERRKVKLFKVIAVVGTVGAFILGSQ